MHKSTFLEGKKLILGNFDNAYLHKPQFLVGKWGQNEKKPRKNSQTPGPNCCVFSSNKIESESDFDSFLNFFLLSKELSTNPDQNLIFILEILICISFIWYNNFVIIKVGHLLSELSRNWSRNFRNSNFTL